MLIRPLLATTLLGVALSAQTAPCISLNDATNASGNLITGYSFAGPGVNAYRFTPSSSLLLMAAELYTSNTNLVNQGYMTLEVWDENPATSLPGTRLGGGTWQVQGSLGADWQGASFDQIVVANAAQNYWLVWRESGWNQVPYQAGGATLPYARFTGGNWVLQATPQPLKWRGYCSLLDAANVLPVGFGCLSSLGRVPAAFTNHAPTIGNANFQIEGTGFPAGSIGLAVLGTNPGWVSIPIPGTPVGCLLHTDPLVTATVLVGTGNQQATHAIGASGHCWFDLAIPANAGLVGTVIGSQFVVLDAGLIDPLPFVFSNGLRITLY